MVLNAGTLYFIILQISVHDVYKTNCFFVFVRLFTRTNNFLPMHMNCGHPDKLTLTDIHTNTHTHTLKCICLIPTLVCRQLLPCTNIFIFRVSRCTFATVVVLKHCVDMSRGPGTQTHCRMRAHHVRVGVPFSERFFTRGSRGCGRGSGFSASVSSVCDWLIFLFLLFLNLTDIICLY